jgi:hypothetical protein
MIRFTKHLLSSTPGDVIEIESQDYKIDSHNETDNIFMTEARRCSVDLFTNNDVTLILESNKIQVSNTVNDAWTDTDFSNYQAELIEDGQVLFTGLVDLKNFKPNTKTQEAKIKLVDVLAIIPALSEIKVGFKSGTGWTPFFQNKTPTEVLTNVLGDTLERCVQSDGIHYDRITSILNYTDSGQTGYEYIETEYDWQTEIDGILFVYHIFNPGYTFWQRHQGRGFKIEEDNQLYFYRWVYIHGYKQDETREDEDASYSIKERFIVYRKHINVTLNASDDWFTVGNWEEYYDNEEQSGSTYNLNDPYWEELIIDPLWIPFFNAWNGTETTGIVYNYSDYNFHFESTPEYVSGVLHNFTGLVIPFQSAHDDNNVYLYSFPDLIKMSLFAGGLQLTCNSAGTLYFNKLTLYNNTHTITSDDLFEEKPKRIDDKIDVGDLFEPFESMGFTSESEEITAIIDEIQAFFNALFNSDYTLEYDMEILNSFNLNVGDKIIYDGSDYRVMSFVLDPDKFYYTAKLWG